MKVWGLSLKLFSIENVFKEVDYSNMRICCSRNISYYYQCWK